MTLFLLVLSGGEALILGWNKAGRWGSKIWHILVVVTSGIVIDELQSLQRVRTLTLYEQGKTKKTLRNKLSYLNPLGSLVRSFEIQIVFFIYDHNLGECIVDAHEETEAK